MAQALSGFATALAKAASDTAMVIGQLGHVADVSAESFHKVGHGG